MIRSRMFTADTKVITTESYRLDDGDFTFVMFLDHHTQANLWTARGYIFPAYEKEPEAYLGYVYAKDVDGYKNPKDARIDLCQAFNEWLGNPENTKKVNTVETFKRIA